MAILFAIDSTNFLAEVSTSAHDSISHCTQPHYTSLLDINTHGKH